MNTAVITTKIDPYTKKQAMKTAGELGMPLSVIIKAFLKQFIQTKSVTFSVNDEIPNDYLKGIMRQAEEDLKAGKGSPILRNGKEAVDYLNKLGL